MAGTALLTLGRLPKGLEIARALHAIGWRVLVAEPFDWHLSRVSRAVSQCFTVRAPRWDPDGYLEDLLRVIKEHSVSLVIPVSEEIAYVARLHEDLPDGTRLYCPYAETVEALQDKARFAERADKLGLTIPATALAGTEEAICIAATSRHVVKPSLSCSGIGVRYAEAGETVPTVSGDIVQAFLDGAHFSTFAIAHDGSLLVNVVYRGTVFSGSVAVAFERVADAPDIEEWVSRFVEETGVSGFIAFDFIRDAAGTARAIECNPRVTSGVHFVDPAGLAKAIAEPAESSSVGLKPIRHMKQFWPVLTETQASVARGIGKGSTFRHNLRTLKNTIDVTWTPRDPLPLLTMPFTSYQILRRTLFHGESFGEASIRDIAYFNVGEPGI